MSTFTIQHKKKINRSYINIFVFVLMIVAFLIAINYTSSSSLKHQEEALNDAIERDIAICYAQNGYYPPSLAYIKEHYGLIYDESYFLVDYRPVADNICPSFSVIKLGGGSNE